MRHVPKAKLQITHVVQLYYAAFIHMFMVHGHVQVDGKRCPQTALLANTLLKVV